MKFALRDDDIDFWTDPSDLESLYRPLWDRGVVTSFAVIPFGVETHHRGDIERFYQVPGTQRGIGDNPSLVTYLKRQIDAGHVDILLHGNDHEYEVRDVAPGEYPWIGECLWKSQGQITREMREGREYLESLFDRPVTVYVPPSNSINEKGIAALEEIGLQLSGTIGRTRDRAISSSYVCAYARRVASAIRFRGLPDPRTYTIGRHKEIASLAITPGVTEASMKAYVDLCIARNQSCVFATHYWELQNHHFLFDLLKRFMLSMPGDFTFSSLSDLYTSGPDSY